MWEDAEGGMMEDSTIPELSREEKFKRVKPIRLARRQTVSCPCGLFPVPFKPCHGVF